MTPDEILEAQKDLMQLLSPENVAFLKARAAKRTEAAGTAQDDAAAGAAAAAATATPPAAGPSAAAAAAAAPAHVDLAGRPLVTPQGEVVAPEELPLVPKPGWLNMNVVEKDKLAWMHSTADSGKTGSGEDGPSSSKAVDAMSQQVRFDLVGAVVPPDADIDVRAGLHHHGDQPDQAGYTLGELTELVCSSVPAQRIIALQTLACIVRRCVVRCVKGCFHLKSRSHPSLMPAFPQSLARRI